MRANRFVLDANIWVSYLITKSEKDLLDIVAESKISLYICKELTDEVEEVLGYAHIQKYNIDTRKALIFIKRIGVNFSLTYPIKTYIPQDPDDNYVIALALQTNSGYVTSGDRHILEAKARLEKRYSKLHILTKKEFEKMFE